MDRQSEYAVAGTPLERAQDLYRSGQLREAEKAYRALLVSEPSGDAAAGLGAILKSTGRLREAGEHYQWALSHCPWSPILLSNASNWLRENGKSPESLSLLERGLQAWPKDLHLKWGIVLSLHQAGRVEQSLRHLEQLIVEHGERPRLLHQLVACLLSCNRLTEALETIEKLQKQEADDETLLKQQLTLLQRVGRGKEAWKILRNQHVITGKELLKTKSLLLLGDGQHEKALILFEKLCDLEPDNGDHWLNLAACQKGMKQMTALLKTLRKAINLHPDRPDLKQAYGSLLIEHGHWNEGLKYMIKSADDPKTTDVQQFNLQFAAAGYRLLTTTELAERVKKWESQAKLSPAPLWSDHIKHQSKTKRLRVGYYSQDLHPNHPVGRFIEPLLREHDPKMVEVVGISCAQSIQIGSDEIKKYCKQWVEVGMASDLEAARQISELELDILVELGGYTGGQKIRSLTAKPAPIQLSYLGYFASTHLDCIDGVIGDTIIFPKGMEGEFPGQTLHRIPRCYMAFEQKDLLEPKRTAPDNRFRFGCFNHSRKLSNPCLDLFTKVLNNNPDSLLVLKSQTFTEPEEKERIRQRFCQRGIPKDRLELLNRSEDTQSHLRSYGRMDVALDPIPYGGATTTAEAIWMGVPVICLAGEGMVGRLSASILEGAGLSAAISKDINQYIELANKLVKTGPRNDEQRLAIKQQVERSELMDAEGLARAIEDTYRKCWHEWIESTSS